VDVTTLKRKHNFFSAQLLECPSIYELLANSNFHWKDAPLLQIWREKLDDNGKKNALLESFEPAEAIRMIQKALSEHEVSCSGFTFR
jgi:phospholipase A1